MPTVINRLVVEEERSSRSVCLDNCLAHNVFILIGRLRVDRVSDWIGGYKRDDGPQGMPIEGGSYKAENDSDVVTPMEINMDNVNLGVISVEIKLGVVC